jgi:hypothetical protein
MGSKPPPEDGISRIVLQIGGTQGRDLGHSTVKERIRYTTTQKHVLIEMSIRFRRLKQHTKR